MADVFLSYARGDSHVPRAIAQALSEWEVWWDDELLPGQRIRNEIAAQLSAAKCVVVLWSTEAVKSDWVPDEAEEGKRRGVLVHAVIDSVSPPQGFQQIHWADLRDRSGLRFEAELSKLKNGIARHVSPSRTSGTVATAAPSVLKSVSPDVAQERWTIGHLESFESPYSDRDALGEQVHALELRLLSLVAEAVNRCLLNGLNPPEAVEANSAFETKWSGIHYQASACPSTEDHQELIVSVTRLGLRASPPVVVVNRMAVDGKGAFPWCTIVLDKSVRHLTPGIAETVRTVLATGNRWLEQFVVSTVSAWTQGTGEALHAVLRRILPGRNAPFVWLAVVTEGKGFYVVDPIVVQHTLTNTSERPVVGGGSPFVQTAALMSEKLPSDLLFAGAACRPSTGTNPGETLRLPT